jgi:integrase
VGFVEPSKFQWVTQSDGKRRKRALKGSPWKARYRDRDGKARSQTFATKTAAQDFLARTSADMQRGDYVDPYERRRRFEHWANTWWPTTVKLRPTTRRVYWQLLQGHVLPYFSGKAMGNIDYMDVERFVAAKLSAGMSPKKVQDAVSVISLIMKCAVKSNARKDNPAAGHEIRVPRRKMRPGDVPDTYKPAVWLMAYTGIRPSELCGLRVSSIDFARRTVHVTETLIPVNKFDDFEHALVPGPPKTDAGDRDIPIPQWLCDDLAAMLAARADERGCVVDRNEYLFLSQRGMPLNRDKFRELIIRPALRAADLPETLRTYDIRHSHASLLIEQGANLLAIAQRMGHTDPAVTLRVYGHLFAGAQDELTRRLDDLRWAVVKPASGGEVVQLALAGAHPGRSSRAAAAGTPATE